VRDKEGRLGEMDGEDMVGCGIWLTLEIKVLDAGCWLSAAGCRLMDAMYLMTLLMTLWQEHAGHV
jgi:hypothetical protein